MTIRIKKDVTITWEMPEHIAGNIFKILQDYDPKGELELENTIEEMLKALYIVLPKEYTHEDR